MKRILFVDDEPPLLDGLQRMLRPQRKQWDMSFARGGEEALALLDANGYDVIVTDMRMPGMDGARLLELVRERFPDVIRIVLSGHVEREAALRAAPLAHQFLSKPCDPAKLRDAIERTLECETMLTSECVRRLAGAVGKLPSMPDTCASLLAALQDPAVELSQVGMIIERDVALTAKVLQLVNSAFFGLRTEITSARQAATYLGLDVLKELVLSVEIFQAFRPAPLHHFSLGDFQKHSRLAARIAAVVPVPPGVGPLGVVAALLHDTGKLVLATRVPEPFELALRTACERGVALHVVEEDLLGTNHAEVGAYLLGLWGLPRDIVQAVYMHHRPAARPCGQELNAVGLTHIADALAEELGGNTTGTGPGGLLDADYLAAHALTDQVPSWRALARQAFEEFA